MAQNGSKGSCQDAVTAVDDAERTCAEEFDLFVDRFQKHYDAGEKAWRSFQKRKEISSLCFEWQEKRFQIFCENLRWIRARNSPSQVTHATCGHRPGESHSYTVGITPFTDLSFEEFRQSHSRSAFRPLQRAQAGVDLLRAKTFETCTAPCAAC